MLNSINPHPLVCALTYDPVSMTINKANRKLFLSECDESERNKRTKLGSLGNESKNNDKNNHRFYSMSLSSSRTTLVNIKNISSSSTMLLCQQKPILNQIEEQEETSIYVTAAELSLYINSSKDRDQDDLLIIDCGLPFRYNERRIRQAFHLNINDKLSRKRFITRGLQNFLDQNQSERFNRSDTFILYDDSIRSISNSCCNARPQYELSSAMKCLYDEIQRYDSTKIVLILQTTFNEFYHQYPMDCETITDQYCSPTPTIDIDSFLMSEVIPSLYFGNANDTRDQNLLEQK